MGSGSELEIPGNSSVDDPVTINVSTATTENFTVKGVQGGGTAAVKINLPEGSKGTVTVENIKSVEIIGGWGQTSSTVSDPLVIAATADTGVEELTVTDIEHVEVSGTWKKATASTGENTFVVKADAVIEDLAVTKGNIEIEQGADVKKLTLEADVTINKSFDILEGKSMEIVLGTHTLTLPVRPEGVDNFIHIYKDASLTITGDAGSKGKVIDKTQGIALANSNTNFTMTNVEYSADHTHAGGILINLYASNAAVEVDNCTMQSVEYCLNTNASIPVGSGNKITLINSAFTAKETALMVNTPVTVTATGCTFTGGWQGAFLRGGTFTFDGCNFGLNVNTVYGTSTVAPGAASWGGGNNAPAAAMTAGNRSTGAYDYKTNITLKGNCSLAVQVGGVDSKDYPAIYLDAEKDKPNQGVTFTDSEATYTTSLTEVGKGFVINNTTGQVTVNGEVYGGSNVPE